MFEIWLSGYCTNGESGIALYYGKHAGKTFADAVVKCVADCMEDPDQYFNKNNLTYWGCKFYDNEADARAVFG